MQKSIFVMVKWFLDFNKYYYISLEFIMGSFFLRDLAGEWVQHYFFFYLEAPVFIYLIDVTLEY